MFCRHRYALVFCFVACIAPASKQTAVAPHSASSHVPARKITVIGVSNFGRVTPHLFRGGQPKLAGYEHLKQMGIDLVVDLRLSGEGNEKQDVNKAGMKFVSLPWHCMFPHDSVFAKFLELLRDNRDKKIFVHCRYGDDRTGMMIAAIAWLTKAGHQRKPATRWRNSAFIISFARGLDPTKNTSPNI
jgi:protein tyrosine/serine phosphatase